MENDTIWKVGLVVLVLLVVVGVYNNNNKFTEEVTGEVIGDSITGMLVDEFLLSVGDSVAFCDKGYITLLNVGSTGSIVVDVDDVTCVISTGNTETCNGVEITNVKAYYSVIAREQRSAKIEVECADLWLQSGTDIYNTNTGNVGIGTTTPEEKLHIYSADSGAKIVAETEGTGLGDNAYLVLKTPKTRTSDVQFWVGDEGRFRIARHQDNYLTLGAFRDSTWQQDLNIMPDGRVNINDLMGSGNTYAYVCVNNAGTLFRSLVPCTSITTPEVNLSSKFK